MSSPVSAVAPAVLAAEGICKAFTLAGRSLPILAGVDLQVATGETVAIRGESGSGKSTLLNILGALERPDAGVVRWSGSAIPARPPAAFRAQQVGLVFQAFYLVPELNALENVLLASRIAGQQPKAEARSRALALLERVGLADRLRSLPSQLSGGERQRVAVARALLNHPAVILADEPTGNLDERTGQAVMEVLLEAARAQGAAVVLVTHSGAFAALASRTLYLSGGRLSAHEPPALAPSPPNT